MGVRLFATLGPGDVAGAHRRQMAGEATASETSIIFSGQLFEYCRLRDIAVLATAHNPRPDRVADGPIAIVQGPKPLAGRGGIAYHLGQLLHAWRLAGMARRHRADLALIDSGTTHYFALWAFAWRGIPVAINFHNVPWPQGFQPQGPAARVLRALDGGFFRRHVRAVAGCSPECGAQADALAGRRLPFHLWCAQFRREGFAPAAADAPVGTPFRILFAGRVEENKGVLDIVRIARLLEDRHPGRIAFDLCGEGGALAAVRAAVAAAGLERVVTIHGRLDRAALLPVYRRSDAVIVPTRGDFCEGMPLACAEAVISGKPIVTSRLSNALPLLGPAIAEAEPEDVDSYAAAIERLAFDPPAYARHRAACPALAARFFDPGTSYPAAIDRVIAEIVPGWTLLSSYDEVMRPLT